MGENAIYKGRTIKIGTCENMYWLRAEQRMSVTRAPNSVDVPRYANVLRFRFPWPDEDGVEPGAFEDFDRAVAIEVSLTGIEHRPECGCDTVYRICQQKIMGTLPDPGPNGSEPTRLRDHLAVVCECAGCGQRFRLETLEEAQPLIDACVARGAMLARARAHGAQVFTAPGALPAALQDPCWWQNVAERIALGYGLVMETEGERATRLARASEEAADAEAVRLFNQEPAPVSATVDKLGNRAQDDGWRQW